MPTYIVRVKHEQVRYAEVEVEAETVPEAAQIIGDIPDLENADSIAEPVDWDIEENTLTVMAITDEDGNIFLDEDTLLAAWEQETEA
jgi:hypothetical protein